MIADTIRPRSEVGLANLSDGVDKSAEQVVSATTSRDGRQQHRKHRSLSCSKATACANQAKPKKPRQYLGSASLTTIPNAIKLSMLNSGLLSVGNTCLDFLYSIKFASFLFWVVFETKFCTLLTTHPVNVKCN